MRGRDCSVECEGGRQRPCSGNGDASKAVLIVERLQRALADLAGWRAGIPQVRMTQTLAVAFFCFRNHYPHTPQILAFHAFEETEIWGKTQFIEPVCEYFLAKICLFADAGPHISSKITSNHDKEAHQGSDSVFYDPI